MDESEKKKRFIDTVYNHPGIRTRDLCILLGMHHNTYRQYKHELAETGDIQLKAGYHGAVLHYVKEKIA